MIFNNKQLERVMVSLKPKFMKTDCDEATIDADANRASGEQTSFVFNANQSLGIKEQQERLPIRKYRDRILYCLENYQIVIIVGETGSGKSTQVPQYLYEAGWHSRGLIGITEPRRVAAITLGHRVAEEMGELVGSTVGFVVRFSERTSEETQIKYMTEGILLQELLADPLLTQYSVIIVDEAHERNLNTDILLGILKKILKRRDTLKLVISSATVDAEFMCNYFNFNFNKDIMPTSVILSVEGRMHPVNMFYLQEPCASYVKESVETVWQIHKTEPTGDILVFLTCQEEILAASDLLNEYIMSTEIDNMKILPMYGNLPKRDQLAVFLNPGKGIRKVVLATNIAETSITIPGIVYVIDCGFVKVTWFNPESCNASLVLVPTSKASALQRAGRAGRIKPGKVFRLYTKEDFEKLPERLPPEIMRTELSSVLLKLKALGIKNILRFDFPQSPPAKNLLAAVESLYALKAMDEMGNLTKPIGFMLAEMPFEPMFGKMLYISDEMGCSEEILTIIAMLQVQNVFSNPVSTQAKLKGRVAKRKFEVAEGDLITLLNVYASFVKNEETSEFCGQHFLLYKNLKRAVELRKQLAGIVTRQFGIKMVSCKGNVEQICKCIAAGFFQNAAYLHHSGIFRNIRSNNELYISPSSCLYSERQPQYLVYCDVLNTNKLYIDKITVVKGDWLAEVAGHYYEKKTGTTNNIFEVLLRY